MTGEPTAALMKVEVPESARIGFDLEQVFDFGHCARNAQQIVGRLDGG